MPEAPLIYELDDRPTWPRLALYGLQWTLLTLPIVIMATNLTAFFLGYEGPAKAALGQRFCLLIGLVMMIQGRWGHRLPLIDGPAGGLLLCLITLAPFGEGAVRAAMLVGGLCLAGLAHFGVLPRLMKLFTANVVGCIVLLIALTLIPFLLPQLIGRDAIHPQGRPLVAGLSLGVILAIPVLGHWLTGFIRTMSVLLALAGGTAVFAWAGQVDISAVSGAPWLAWPTPWPMVVPDFSIPALVSGSLAYLIILLNMIGSLAAIQAIVGGGETEARTRRSAAVTGWSGVAASLFGVYGTVAYAYSPGIVLATGVGSRFATVAAGAMIFGLGFMQKITALLASVPVAVVAASMVAAMSSQIGAGLSILSRDRRELTGRDYFVIGLPLLLGTLCSIMGQGFRELLPLWLGPIMENGLVVGMVSLMLLEHLLLRQRD